MAPGGRQDFMGQLLEPPVLLVGEAHRRTQDLFDEIRIGPPLGGQQYGIGRLGGQKVGQIGKATQSTAQAHDRLLQIRDGIQAASAIERSTRRCETRSNRMLASPGSTPDSSAAASR